MVCPSHSVQSRSPPPLFSSSREPHVPSSVLAAPSAASATLPAPQACGRGTTPCPAAVSAAAVAVGPSSVGTVSSAKGVARLLPSCVLPPVLHYLGGPFLLLPVAPGCRQNRAAVVHPALCPAEKLPPRAKKARPRATEVPQMTTAAAPGAPGHEEWPCPVETGVKESRAWRPRPRSRRR